MKNMRFELKDSTYHKLVELKGRLRAEDWPDLMDKILVEIGTWFWEENPVLLNEKDYFQIVTDYPADNTIKISPPSGCEIDIPGTPEGHFVIDGIPKGMVSLHVLKANADTDILGDYKFEEGVPIPIIMPNKNNILTLTPATRLALIFSTPLKGLKFKLRAVIRLKSM